MIGYYNKKSNIPNSIMLLIKDIWKLNYDINIYYCHHNYKEVNKTTNYFIKKNIFAIYIIHHIEINKFEFKDYCDQSCNTMYI